MKTHRSRLRVALALGLLATSAACGEDKVLNPTFGSRCSAGSLSAGQSVEGVLNESSCSVPYHFWSGNRVAYESYSVSLEKGRGYHFHLQSRSDEDGNNNVDALLTLYGKNADGVSVPLVISDDEANGSSGRDSEFYFIAPRSGTFQLVASNYDLSSGGGYRLSMDRCPVVATLDTAGTYEDIDLVDSPCIRHSPDATGDPTKIVLISVPTDGAESVAVTVNSSDFTPVIELGGPGFDMFGNIYDNDFGSANGRPALTTVSSSAGAGTLTLAVGAEDFGAVGSFEASLVRTPMAMLGAGSSQRSEMPLTFTPRVPKRR